MKYPAMGHLGTLNTPGGYHGSNALQWCSACGQKSTTLTTRPQKPSPLMNLSFLYMVGYLKNWKYLRSQTSNHHHKTLKPNLSEHNPR